MPKIPAKAEDLSEYSLDIHDIQLYSMYDPWIPFGFLICSDFKN